MRGLTHAPDAVLRAADRVFALAPFFTWRWRFAIYCEALRRSCEVHRAPEMAVWGAEEFGC